MDDKALFSLPGIISAITPFLSHDGQPDQEKLRALFGIPHTEWSTWVNRRSPQCLHSYLRIASLLALNPNPENFRNWLNTPNQEFNELSPLAVIRKHGPDPVAALVRDILVNRGG